MRASGWDLDPAVPKMTGEVVMLVDRRARSYAESVIGYLHGGRGTLVGGPSAGASGGGLKFAGAKS